MSCPAPPRARPAAAALGPRIQRVLDAARAYLGMDVAWFSHFENGRQVIQAASGDLHALGGLAIGDSASLEDSFCLRVLRGQLPAAIPDARRDLRTRDLPVTDALNIGSYVGHPIPGADGEPLGMLCCLSRSATPGLTEQAGDFLGVLIALLHDELPDWEEPVAAARADTRARVERCMAAGRLRPVFQPVVRLDDETVVGYEALTRFSDPAAGNPAEVFADAAAVGLGVDLELVAMDLALAQRGLIPADRWLSVNLSPAAVLSRRALDRLLPLAAHNLAIEITEHAPVADYGELTACLQQLTDQGIRIAVDDAGAGFASLRHILRLAPSIIKLDIEITRDIDADPVRQALASALATFARTTGAVLLAEGVERREEAATLCALGVDLAQGYLFGRPAPLPHR